MGALWCGVRTARDMNQILGTSKAGRPLLRPPHARRGPATPVLPCPFARPATSWARRPEAGQEPRGLQRGEGAGGGEGFLFALFFCLFFPRARWVTAEPWGQSPPRDPRRHPPPPPASFAPPCYTPPLAPLAGVGASVDAHALGCLLLLGARRCGGGLSGCGFFVVFFWGGCCRLEAVVGLWGWRVLSGA